MSKITIEELKKNTLDFMVNFKISYNDIGRMAKIHPSTIWNHLHNKRKVKFDFFIELFNNLKSSIELEGITTASQINSKKKQVDLILNKLKKLK
jgi:hypothetical protein